MVTCTVSLIYRGGEWSFGKKKQTNKQRKKTGCGKKLVDLHGSCSLFCWEVFYILESLFSEEVLKIKEK